MGKDIQPVQQVGELFDAPVSQKLDDYKFDGFGSGWEVNDGKVPCPINADTLVHIQRGNLSQSIGKAGDVGVWQFSKLTQSEQDIISYRCAKKKGDERVKGEMEKNDRSHPFRCGDDVFIRNSRSGGGQEIRHAEVRGWVQDSQGKLVTYLVEISDKNFEDVKPEDIELDGVPYRDDD